MMGPNVVSNVAIGLGMAVRVFGGVCDDAVFGIWDEMLERRVLRTTRGVGKT